MAKCKYNYDHENCGEEDCVFNGILPSEREEIRQRDKALISYGSVVKAKPAKVSRKRKYYS